MSLIEHLEELRRRLIHSAIYLVVGFFVAYYFHDGIAAMMQRPITTALARHHLNPQLVYLNPIEPFNFYLKLAFVGGAIGAGAGASIAAAESGPALKSQGSASFVRKRGTGLRCARPAAQGFTH